MLRLLVCGPHWEQHLSRSGLGTWTVFDIFAKVAIFKTIGSKLSYRWTHGTNGIG